MALIDYVSAEETDGRVRELLEAYEEEHGKYGLFNEALANNPAVFEARYGYGTALMEGGRVDPDIKEFVFVVVSEANSCEYCVGDHKRALLERFDADEAELEHVTNREFERLPDRKRAVAAFADQVARDPKRVTDAHLDDLGAIGYDDEAVIELLVVATLGISANAIVDALSIHPTDRE
jgi:uncharacterized peroxidase-related enzyme